MKSRGPWSSSVLQALESEGSVIWRKGEDLSRSHHAHSDAGSGEGGQGRFGVLKGLANDVLVRLVGGGAELEGVHFCEVISDLHTTWRCFHGEKLSMHRKGDAAKARSGSARTTHPRAAPAAAATRWGRWMDVGVVWTGWGAVSMANVFYFSSEDDDAPLTKPRALSFLSSFFFVYPQQHTPVCTRSSRKIAY